MSTAIQFERSDISLFRNLATLAQKAGVPQQHLSKLAFKELADNALDAGGNVTFEHEGDLTWVKDDGGGLDGSDAEIASLFSIGRPMRSTKLLRLPTRGALGNGLRVVVGLVLCTNGRLVVRTRGRELELTPQDNGDTVVASSTPWNGTGTAVGVSFGNAEDDMLDWASVSSGHLGTGDYKGESSPFWYDSDSFYELCQSSPRGLSARALVERLDGCSGRKAGIIAAQFLNRMVRDLTRAEADQLLITARTHAKEVTPKRLGFVGEQKEKFSGYGKAHDVIEMQGRGACVAKMPVVVEAWAKASYRPSSIVLMVNRTVAVGDVAVKSIDRSLWISGCQYNGGHLPSGGRNYQIEVNIQTPHMPITSDGKAPTLAGFKHLLDKAIKAAVGRAKRTAGVIPREVGGRWTFKDSVLKHLDEAIALASGDGQYRFNLRNLFYQVRPFVGREVGELAYPTFTNIITDYENDRGPIKGMFRNERGTLIHPHTGEEIGLGTLSVEKYARPAWGFNKILYVEKEGFFQTLLADKWPERHDCALMTSQGYASRAARDLIDAMSNTDEPIEIFCVHDADAFGTKIYETLQEATRARPERKVQIINLGLERGEAEDMELEVEDLPDAKKEKPTAYYVSEEDHEWYQTHRYELNAMTAAQLIKWLDEKMAEYEGKVVPPEDVMRDALREGVEEHVRARETARILLEAGIDRIVNERMDALADAIGSASVDEHVREHVAENETDSWKDGVSTLAEEIASA